MAARAAKPVVEIEMAERGIEIVTPQQADHAATEPDALGVPARPLRTRAASANSSTFCAFPASEVAAGQAARRASRRGSEPGLTGLLC